MVVVVPFQLILRRLLQVKIKQYILNTARISSVTAWLLVVFLLKFDEFP